MVSDTCCLKLLQMSLFVLFREVSVSPAGLVTVHRGTTPQEDCCCFAVEKRMKVEFPLRHQHLACEQPPGTEWNMLCKSMQFVLGSRVESIGHHIACSESVADRNNIVCQTGASTPMDCASESRSLATGNSDALQAGLHFAQRDNGGYDPSQLSRIRRGADRPRRDPSRTPIPVRDPTR